MNDDDRTTNGPPGASPMSWFDPTPVSNQAERWLLDIGRLRTTAAVSRILSRCLNRAEVELIVAYISTPGWFVTDEDSLANQEMIITPRASIGDFTVSLLVEYRSGGERWAFDIVSEHRKSVVTNEGREAAI